jgi:hypothetical protein
VFPFKNNFLNKNKNKGRITNNSGHKIRMIELTSIINENFEKIENKNKKQKMTTIPNN